MISLEQSTIHMSRFVRHFIDSGWEVTPVVIDGVWLEVDTPEEFELYRFSSETDQHRNIFSVV